MAFLANYSAALRTLLFFLVAAAVPFIVLGRAALAGALILGLLSYPFALPGSDAWARAVRSARSLTGLLVVATFAAWMPGAFESVEFLRSFEAVSRTLVFVVCAMLFWSALYEDAAGLAGRAFVGIAASMTAFAVVALVALPEIIMLIRQGAWTDGPVAHLLKESGSAAVLMIPVLALFAARLNGAWRWVAILSIAGLLAVIPLTGSRSAVAGLGAMAVVIILLRVAYSRNVIWFASASGLVLLSIVAAVFAAYEIKPNVPGLGVELFLPAWLVDPHRQEIWRYVLELTQDHRWFGVGANAVDKLPGAGEFIEGTKYRRLPLHPHNWAVEVTVETGIVGMAALVVLIGHFLRRQVLRYLASGDGAYLAMIAVWAGYWVSGLFNFSFWSAWWQCSFLVMTALCLSQCRRNGDPVKPGTAER